MKKKIVIPLLGAHISAAGGLHKSIDRAEEIGCTTMQIFTKNNKAWFAPEITKEEAELFKKAYKESKLARIMVHTSYLINIASANESVERKSIAALKHELHRCEQLEIPYLILHPGSHLGAGDEKGIKKISKNLDLVLEKATGKTKILLETMAGQGTNIGYKFGQLSEIIDSCSSKKLLGVCLDTCHIFNAGYDISTKESYQKVIKDFYKEIGIKRLEAIHLNDSETELNSRKDRHANIGEGVIPMKTFELIMNDKRLEKIPKVLETPTDAAGKIHEREIKLLKKLVKPS